MTTTAQLNIPMVPALESVFPEPNLGDVTSVPAVHVRLDWADRQLQCVGLIDTGAELCLLDEELFASLQGERRREPERTAHVRLPARAVKADVHLMSVCILGDKDANQVQFDRVPVAVVPLDRRVFVVGRRGVLEWLSLEMDFPQQRFSLRLERAGSEKYPALSQAFPALASAVHEGEEAQAVTLLAWDLERYVDQLGSAFPPLESAIAEIPLRERTLAKKLDAAANAIGGSGLAEAVSTVVRARNAGSHGPSDDVSAEQVLNAAEAIVAELSKAAQDVNGQHLRAVEP